MPEQRTKRFFSLPARNMSGTVTRSPSSQVMAHASHSRSVGVSRLTLKEEMNSRSYERYGRSIGPSADFARTIILRVIQSQRSQHVCNWKFDSKFSILMGINISIGDMHSCLER
jgi:hypothetical protein